ncbi:MAG TPA: zinc ribbon domain-containing protein [Vicinamibacteria bacterium]|nr:zinc ribbon domain-containing protein [Vicinamibacteria bacterium]
MPIYEYACRDCGRRFERLVRAFGEPVACPACASGAVEKLLSTFAMAGGGDDRGTAPRGGGGCCGGSCGCAH